MKKRLGILVASAALLITACQTPASSSNEQPSWEPTSSSTEDVVRVTGVTLDRNNISLNEINSSVDIIDERETDTLDEFNNLIKGDKN